LSQIYEISQAKPDEVLWHIFTHGSSVFIFITSFYQEKYPMAVEILYCLEGFCKTTGHIWLRNRQLKNKSYIMVSPVYMMAQACATYIMSISATAYFSESTMAILLIFQINFALTILYVYNPLLNIEKTNIKTFFAEYLTVSIMVNVAVFYYRYDHTSREI
jgi:hypothetical protein